MTEEQSYLEFAKALALKAGAMMREHLQIGIDRRIKSDGSPVTIADQKINELVIESISAMYPGFGIITEEAPAIEGAAEYTWVCDPLDGTVPYMFGAPLSLFSLALVKNGVPILGVMYDPFEQRMYHALRGHGAYVNEKRIRVSEAKTLPIIMSLYPEQKSDYWTQLACWLM